MEAKRAISAGGVIFKPSGEGVEVALISVKDGKVWGLPKGLKKKVATITEEFLSNMAPLSTAFQGASTPYTDSF